MSVIKVSANRASGDHYADKLSFRFATDGEFLTYNRLVMPVIKGNKFICCFK